MEEKILEKQKEPKIRNLLKHKLLQDNVLIVAVDFPQEGKVFKPNQYEDKPEYGLVVRTGMGRLLDNGSRVPCPVKEGDFVVFGKYSSQKVRAEGVDFLFVRDEDILSVYEG